MSLPVIINLDDGTTDVDVPACTTRVYTITADDTKTGYGVIEYLTGKARRWALFRRRTWNFQASGRAASGIEALDLTAAYWTATFLDPTDPTGADLVVTVVPFLPIESYRQPSAEHTVGFTLEETLS